MLGFAIALGALRTGRECVSLDARQGFAHAGVRFVSGCGRVRVVTVLAGVRPRAVLVDHGER
jgi:hypothetical protein